MAVHHIGNPVQVIAEVNRTARRESKPLVFIAIAPTRRCVDPIAPEVAVKSDEIKR